ncbi:hypothetical protein [Streptomyces roseifaciens]|uniref:hypothetical protein n=1 Tax=Streptomyces roseifaciens TaxID=1488406 RepID=UPI0007181C75|nr:hypothetical protein [Streptomyces roseifaciens]
MTSEEPLAAVASEEIPEQPPRPPVRVFLPDGQTVICQLDGWAQTAAGEWLCTVTLSVWSHVQLGSGRDVTEPCEIAFDVAAARVSRLPGVSYEGVPRRRHQLAVARARTGRQPPPPSPSSAPVPAAGNPAPAPPRRTAPQPPPGAQDEEACTAGAQPQTWPPVRGDGTDRWMIRRLRNRGEGILIHHEECFLAS